MQTILGANGAIGTELTKSLAAFTREIRLVSRNPKQVNESDQLFPADLLNRAAVFEAVKGSQITYLCAGLKYDIKTWRAQWPVIMRNVLDACAEHKSKLVFVDNVYAIGGDQVKHITEDSPLSPSSKKGEVRANLVRMIEKDVTDGKIEAIIARCADYYGPYPQLSVPMTVSYSNFVKGSKAQWLFDPKVKHTYTYTKDAGKALALLGNTPDAFNQTWNLPTAAPGLTGEEFIEMVAERMGKSSRYTTVPAWMVRLLGVFVPIMKELYEMRYQFDRYYWLDSSKFENRFGITPTPYKQGIEETLAELSRAPD